MRTLCWTLLALCTAALALGPLTACAHAIHVYIGGDHQHAETVEKQNHCSQSSGTAAEFSGFPETRNPQSRPAEVGE